MGEWDSLVSITDFGNESTMRNVIKEDNTVSITQFLLLIKSTLKKWDHEFFHTGHNF